MEQIQLLKNHHDNKGDGTITPHPARRHPPLVIAVWKERKKVRGQSLAGDGLLWWYVEESFVKNVRWMKKATNPSKETPKDTYTRACMHTCTYQDKHKLMLSKRRATVQLIDQVNHPSSLGIQRNTQITPFVEILFIPRFVLSISISIYPAFIPVLLSSHNVEHHEQAVCPLSTSQP